MKKKNFIKEFLVTNKQRFDCTLIDEYFRNYYSNSVELDAQLEQERLMNEECNIYYSSLWKDELFKGEL